jgi:hypothetical protein
VRVAGLKRTKNDIVVEQIKDVLEATSLHELYVKSLESMTQLKRLNIFKDVYIYLDRDKRGAKGNKKGVEPKAEVRTKGVWSKHVRSEDSVEVIFFVEEKGLTNFGIEANAGTQSGDAVSHSYSVILCTCTWKFSPRENFRLYHANFLSYVMIA